MAVIPVFSGLGLFCDAWLQQHLQPLLYRVDLKYPGHDAVRLIWSVALGIHAGVGAIAPTLGFSLLSSVVDAAQFPAPAPFIVADAVKWNRYLSFSLATLIGSLIAYAMVPSATGAVAAVFATAGTVLMTLRCFWNSFELLRDESELDRHVRAYMQKLIREAATPLKPSKRLCKDSHAAKVRLEDLPSSRSGMTEALRATLYLYGNGDLIKVDPNEIQSLLNQAADHDLQLYRRDLDIPASLDGWPVPFLDVESAPEPSLCKDDLPTKTDDTSAFEQRVKVLQEQLNRAIEYAPTTRHLEQDRAERLINRRLAKLLYTALTESQPHELEYGLSVLGEVVDELSRTAPARLDAFDTKFEWFYRIPHNLVRRLKAQGDADLAVAVKLAGFLRSRLQYWLAPGNGVTYSRAIGLYEQVLEELLLIAALAGSDAADAIALRVKELPLLVGDAERDPPDQAFRVAAMVIARALLKVREIDSCPAGVQEILMRYAWDIFQFGTYSRKNDRAFLKLTSEFAVGFLAALLLQASENDEPLDHLVERFLEYFNRLPVDLWSRPATLFAAVRHTDNLLQGWGWEIWEIRRKASDRAHWLAMGTWCRRAAAILLAQQYWRVEGVPGEELPKLDVLDGILRAIGTEDQRQWMALLPGRERNSVLQLIPELEDAKQRRQEYQDSLATSLPLDQAKCGKWVTKVADNISGAMQPHIQWLNELGSMKINVNPGGRYSAFQTLIEKSYFVQPGKLDRNVGLLPPPYGNQIVNFELRHIAHELLASVPRERQESIASVTDSALWHYVDELIEQSNGNPTSVLLLDTGIQDYSLWQILDEKGIRQNGSDTRESPRIVRAPRAPEHPAALIVGLGAQSFTLERMSPPEQLPAVIERVVTGNDAASIAVELAEITDDQKRIWAENIAEAELLRARQQVWDASLLFRIAWSFCVHIQPDPVCRVFVLDPADR